MRSPISFGTPASQFLSRRTGRLPWLLLLLWATWLYALQGRLAAQPGWGRWMPDLGLLLLLSLDARVTRELAWRVALVVALGRLATGADPPLAVLVATLGVVGFSGPLRELVLLDRPLTGALFAGLAALVTGAYLVVAQRVVEPALGLGLSPLGAALRPALGTALAALFLLPFLRLLPGLSPLQRVRR